MNTQDKVVSLKVSILKGGLTQMRRVRLYEPNIEVVGKVVKDWVCGGFTLNYVDDEGDEVLMETEEEWQECVYVAEKQGFDVVKILVRCTGRARSPSVSSATSVCTDSTSTFSDEDVKEDETPVAQDTPLVPIEELLASIGQDEEREEDVNEEEEEGDETPAPQPVAQPLVPIEELLASIGRLEEEEEEETPTPEPTFDIDPVPTPRSVGSEPEPTPTPEAFEPFRDYDMSEKIEVILRRLYGGSYVDMLVNGVMTPESLGCGEWLVATPSPTGCYFEIVSSEAIVKKLTTVGEGQIEKHDYEGAAVWFEMCTDLDSMGSMSWYNFAKAQALYERVECINALAMAVAYGGDEILRKAEKERAFRSVSHLDEFKETIPGYDAAEELRRKCQGCHLLLGENTLPMQKFCCGRCRSHKNRGHTGNCRGVLPSLTRDMQSSTPFRNIPYRYHSEVLELTSMGFNDIDKVKRVVEKHQGNVEASLLELLH